ncbi:hypothetical protein [Spirosoma pollinicola]|uniref:hypothetical protein n=1 Tax=Spirosoma pollinicola TaxID=2057025 RepID=UPI0012FD1E66|nr:hypothetical protein [Spirosoma pollinicola]
MSIHSIQEINGLRIRTIGTFLILLFLIVESSSAQTSKLKPCFEKAEFPELLRMAAGKV